MSFRLLATVELHEEAIGCRNQVLLLRQIVRSQGHTAQEFSKQFRPLPIRKSFKVVEQLFGSLRHESRFAPSVLGVKFVGESEVE
jgi:hypothetical protein